MAEDIIQLDKYRKVMDTRQIKLRMGEGGRGRKNKQVAATRLKNGTPLRGWEQVAAMRLGTNQS